MSKEIIELEDGEILIEEDIKPKGKRIILASNSSSSSSSSSESRSLSSVQLIPPDKVIKKIFKKDLSKKQICRDFVKGKCKLGQRCSLSHNLGQHPCPYYNFLGGCQKQKNQCKYLHNHLKSDKDVIQLIEDHPDIIQRLQNQGVALKIKPSILQKIPHVLKQQRQIQQKQQQSNQTTSILSQQISKPTLQQPQQKVRLQQQQPQLHQRQQQISNQQQQQQQQQQLLQTQQHQMQQIQHHSFNYNLPQQYSNQNQVNTFTQVSHQQPPIQAQNYYVNASLGIQQSQTFPKYQNNNIQTRNLNIMPPIIQVAQIPQPNQEPQYLQQNDKLLETFKLLANKDPSAAVATEFLITNQKNQLDVHLSKLIEKAAAARFLKMCVEKSSIQGEELLRLLKREPKKLPIIQLLKYIDLNPFQLLVQEKLIIQELNQEILSDIDGQKLIGVYIPKFQEQNVKIISSVQVSPITPPLNLTIEQEEIQELNLNNDSLGGENKDTPKIDEEIKEKFKQFVKTSKNPSSLFQK